MTHLRYALHRTNLYKMLKIYKIENCCLINIKYFILVH